MQSARTKIHPLTFISKRNSPYISRQKQNRHPNLPVNHHKNNNNKNIHNNGSVKDSKKILHMPQVQLFTKLKNIKQKHYSSLTEQYKPTLVLTQYQQQLLQMLKLQKVTAIVRDCIINNITVAEAMSNGHVLNNLDQQILAILESKQERKYVKEEAKSNPKALQSTAEYTVEPQKVRLLEEESFSQVPHIHSTIKNLQSPNPTHLKISPTQFQSFNRGPKPQQNENTQVGQFTLGQLSAQDNENFTERERLDMLESDSIALNETNKNSTGFRISQFSGISESGVQSQKKKQKNEQKNRILCFNRKKIPKGKAIKYKVMGNNTDNHI